MTTVNAKTIDGDYTTIEGAEIEKFKTSLGNGDVGEILTFE